MFIFLKNCGLYDHVIRNTTVFPIIEKHIDIVKISPKGKFLNQKCINYQVDVNEAQSKFLFSK